MEVNKDILKFKKWHFSEIHIFHEVIEREIAQETTDKVTEGVKESVSKDKYNQMGQLSVYSLMSPFHGQSDDLQLWNGNKRLCN